MNLAIVQADTKATGIVCTGLGTAMQAPRALLAVWGNTRFALGKSITNAAQGQYPSQCGSRDTFDRSATGD